ncbi:hypothetical protein BH11PAT2_BH11PAT2_04350 [soil metagenome]
MEHSAPPPVSPTLHAEARTTPKDFFLWLGAVIALYASITALITLLFQYINVVYPDSLAGYSDPYGGTMRAAMATIIVLVPTTVVLFRIIRKISEEDSSKLHTWVRRWALVLTIFIASVTILIDLITLVTTFLGGEITIRFALKAGVILLIALGIFLHFVADMKGYWIAQPKRATIIGIAFGVVAAVVVIAGFFIVGTPQQARLLRYDEQKVQDLQSIQYQITDYYQLKRTVPANLNELNDSFSGYTVPEDAQSSTSYEYSVASPTSFSLCATFNAPSPDAAKAVSYPSYYGGPEQSFAHEAGHQCFERAIDPAKYPAAPKAL